MSVLSTVKDLKESLSKELSDVIEDSKDEAVERCQDILKQLDTVTGITLEILSETLIGTVVSKLKHHDVLGEPAKLLVKKWKKVAKSESTTTSTTSATPPSSPPAKKKEIKKTALSTTAAKKKKKSTTKATTTAAPAPESSVIINASDYIIEEHDDSATAPWIGLPEQRQTIAKKFRDLLVAVKPDLLKQGINEEAIDHLVNQRAGEVEAAVHMQQKNDRKAYADKARSLAFNLKKNTELCTELILGSTDPKDLVKLTSEQLADSETRKKRALEAKKVSDSKRLDWDQANEDKINEMCGIKGDLLKASLFTCGRCKSIKTTSTQKQTRSADEPMTVFVLCLNCNNRWKC